MRGGVYAPRLNEERHCSAGPAEEVNGYEECCLVCPYCGNLFEVKGIRKVELEGFLNKSGELTLDEDPKRDEILELYCGECRGKLEVGKYVKETV